jgi:hypothetical protein
VKLIVEELSQTLLQTLGTVVILGSIAAFILVYNSDTTVEYAPGQYVHNIGLMEQRRDRMLLCGIFAALGFAMVISGQIFKPRESAKPEVGNRAPRLARRDRRQEDDYREGRPASRGVAHSLGIASMVLGAVALPFSLIPCMGFLSLPLSGLGLLLGFVGGIVALSRNGSGIGFPIAGSALCAMSLIFGALWLGVLNAAAEARSPVRVIPRNDDLPPRPSQRPAPPEQPKPQPNSQPKPAPAASGDDRGQETLIGESADCGDVRLFLTCTGVHHVPLVPAGMGQIRPEEYDEMKTSSAAVFARKAALATAGGERCLCFWIALGNRSDTRKIDFESWDGGNQLLNRRAPRLTDNFGNVYNWMTFGPVLEPVFHTASASIHPQKLIIDVLHFEPPIADAKYLILELPRSAFGGEGSPIRFRIPASEIQGTSKPAPAPVPAPATPPVPGPKAGDPVPIGGVFSFNDLSIGLSASSKVARVVLVPGGTGRLGPGDAPLVLNEVRMAEVRKLALTRGYDYSKSKYLVLYVYLTNHSTSKKSALNYESWAGPLQNPHTPRLTDDLGNTYDLAKFALGYEPLFHTASESIHPGKTILDALVFEAPVAEAKRLSLELPASAFGSSGPPVRFRIPTSEVR